MSPDGFSGPSGMIQPIQPNLAPDWEQIEALVGRLVTVAAGHGGEFLVSGLGENPRTGKKLPPIHLHPSNDHTARENILRDIETVVTKDRRYNCTALMQPELKQFQKGESDVLGVLAAVTDWDGENDPDTRCDRLPAAMPKAPLERMFETAAPIAAQL